MSLKARITEDMKSALRGGDKLRLGTIRMLMAAVQQREVDDRREMGEADILQIVEKLIKQRREAAAQFAAGGRMDLETRELAEADILSSYLPAQLAEAELHALLEQAIRSTGATTMKDMGKVMNALKPQVQGRVNMSELSQLVKARLNA
jgi:uncharacterized protein YqeY